MKENYDILKLLINCFVVELDDYYSVSIDDEIQFKGYGSFELFKKLKERNFVKYKKKKKTDYLCMKHKNFDNVRIILT